MTCELLSKGRSVFHRADPRVKVLLACLLSVETVFLTSFLSLAAALLGGAWMLWKTGIPRNVLMRRMLVVNVFVAALWLVLPITTPGRVIIGLGPAEVTEQGLFVCSGITLKCNAIVMFNMALLSTSSIFSLAHALDHLKVPSVLVQLFFFSWRYLHVIEEEYHRIRRAAMLRGFRPTTNLFTYRTYANILGTLFVRSYDRGQRVYWAMICRGFDGTFWLLSHFRLKRSDLALAATILAFASGLFFMEWSRNWL